MGLDSLDLGIPPPGPPPFDETIAKLRAIINSSTQVITNILNAITSISDSKEFGCERCTYCTLTISKIIGKWIEDDNCADRGIIITLIPRLASFPRALLLLLKNFLGAAAGNKEISDALPPQFTALREKADLAYKEGKFIVFSRIAAILEKLKDEIYRIYSGSTRMDVVKDDLQYVARLSEDLLKDYRLLSKLKEDRRKDDGVLIKGEKRVCGGGQFLFNESERGIIVNFSQKHALAVVDREYPVERRMKCTFTPCPRELSFQCEIAARVTQRKKGYESKITPKEPQWSQCGGSMQVFSIEKIDMEYYYLSLCAVSTSQREDFEVDEFLNRYDVLFPPTLS